MKLLSRNANKFDRRRFLISVSASAAAGWLAYGVPNSFAASTASPEVLKIVVFTQAGSAADLLARLLGKALEEMFGQKAIVENTTGAGGIIAAEYVRRSNPDGRTLLLAHEGVMAIAPVLHKNLPYDPLRDFVPISLLAETDFLLVTNRSKGPHTLDELIAEAKKRPGRLNYASAGIGTPHHLGMELLKQQAGIDLIHVAYKGGPGALADVVAGRIDVMLIGITPALSHVKADRLSVLGISGNQGSELVPNVQPLSAKLPGFRLTTWFGLFAPAGTPQTTIEELGRKMSNAVKSTEIGVALFAQGVVAVGGGNKELAARLISDTDKFAKLAQELKM